MWVFFFFSKCVKFVLFSILEDYRWTNVVAQTRTRRKINNIIWIFFFFFFFFDDMGELHSD